MTPDGVLTTLVSFDGTNGVGPIVLIQASDGDFYGICGAGDIHPGSVFRMTTNGTITSLFSFDGTGRDINSPRGLIEGSDGNLYGTTIGGNRGTVFRMTTTGVLTKLAQLNFALGYYPYSGVIQSHDGNFYGTAAKGAGNFGSVFRMKPDGTLTSLFSFHGYDGGNPYGGLVQGKDGNYYGTTYSGGANNAGTVFRIIMPVALNCRVSGNELVLSWPTNALGFTLQSAADLNSSTNLIDSTNAPTTVGAQFTVTNSISGSAQFYRLRKP